MVPPAWAHVSVSPSTAAQGAFVTLTFQVPNEIDDANTSKLVVQFPEDPVFTSARTKPIPGWTATIQKANLTTPLTDDEGGSINERIASITWTAAEGQGIKPPEFQQFLVSTRMPEGADEVLFPAIQTYDNGEEVRWVQQTPEGGPEPDNPAPAVELTEAEGDGHGAAAPTTVATGTASSTTSDDGDDSDDDSSQTLAIIALIVGAVGVLIGGVALVRGRSA
jgi:uncharacterized protein YcnI